MGILIAVLVLVGVLLVLDLVLTFGVIKRLRTHSELIGRALENRVPAGPVMVAEGNLVADFTARTVDGAEVSRSGFTGQTLVGFFAVECDTCIDKLPDFVEHAKDHPRDHVLAVVQGDTAGAAEFTARLAPVARVVVEPVGGVVSKAFEVRGTPVVAMLGPGGRVVAAGFQPEVLPRLAVR
ncbi:hypothetical protein GCM10027598_23820 [Amycolatopsis oliviviridis]|uniref:Thioredoxin domain-containing protein n=1 Tax=Amycolatopsis oliviviridis TaxID=1471590 RepID=A0ABQ3LHB6_9PSEU|nr:hypothetical protein [Amycolatopsis oliviviridis]GHH16178.1 hypothetical protein GCM10017790_31460 [Amycolatopsis oliviviridis]